MKKVREPQLDMHRIGLAPYRLFGDRINRALPLFRDLEKQMHRANIKIAFPAYVAFLLFYPTITGGLIFAFSLLLSIYLGATMLISILVASVLGILSGILLLTVFYAYPSMQVDTRKRLLDEELPYVASHLAVLSRAGLPPEKVFMAMTRVESSGFRGVAAEEAKEIVRDVRLLGHDIISAMERRIRISPSRSFVDFLDGFISVTRSGGDLTAYFLSMAKSMMDHARIVARQLIETLGGIAEVYVSMMVVFPLLMIIMLSVMGMVGGGLGGFSIYSIMLLVTYIIIPIMAVALLVFLDTIMPSR